MSTLEGNNQTTTASTSSFVSALVLNLVIFGVEIVAFTILRPRFPNVYSPRSVALLSSKRVKPMVTGLFTWPLHVFNTDPENIKSINGLDAYFFVRFLRMMVRMLLPIWLLSWIVLMPVTSVGPNTGQPGKTGLDMFVFGNVVVPAGAARYAAHIILVYFFTIWILWNIRYEMKKFIPIRQRHLLDPAHAHSAQATTLLITGIPERYLSVPALTKMYQSLPGGISRVWINYNLQDLPDIYDRRNSAVNKLESAETTLLTTAYSLMQKQHKKDTKAAKKSGVEPPTSPISPTADPERDVTRIEKYVPRDKRPTRRLPWKFIPFSLPFIGEKVDTIDWARKEIEETTALLEEKRALIGQPSAHPQDQEAVEKKHHSAGKVVEKVNERVLGKTNSQYPPLNSAFITFNTQIAAHIAHNALAHHEPYRMTGRYVEVAPSEVIWGNLSLNPYEQKIRQVIGFAMTAGLIILWIFPVIFVGIVSNIKTVCSSVAFLGWICTLPAPVVGIISGILPPVLLAVLTMLLPIILRLIAKFEGIPVRNGVELSLMTRFFIFQVIHNFLIVSFSSGLLGAIPTIINNPTSVPTTLAANLPTASIFFLTYILLQGLSGTAGGFLQIVGLIIYYVKIKLLSSTPRSVYNLRYGGSSVAWGTLFPAMTLITTIALGYSIIAPIINGLACAAFFLFYNLYKYLFTYVYTQPRTSETGGLFFPKAIGHIFVGLYVQLVCLAALFFLGKAIPEGALTIVLIVIVVFFHLYINNSYGPLLTDLPLSLASLDAQPSHDGSSARPSTSSPIEHKDESPIVQAKQPAVGSADFTPESYDEEMNHRYGFAQPAASRPMTTIWLPADPMGLYKEEEIANQERGILTSTESAKMDDHGKVSVEGPPPFA